jgi:ribosomal protein S18 acetylase RimI-like enzyme
MAPTVALRPARPSDRDLLFGVYASAREAELAPLNWPADERTAFLSQQFDAQEAAYRSYEGASFDVVLVDGDPCGRLYVSRWPGEIRIIDIALLPHARGRGVGTHLIEGLLAEAAADGRCVSIHVEAGNPAKRLYARHGFETAETLPGGIYERWEARPTGAAGKCPEAL